jgi:hypothetical protein
MHDLLMAAIRNYFNLKKDVYFTLSEKQKSEYIEKQIFGDNKIASELKAMVKGRFTVAEYYFYILNKNEVNKRIKSILLKRALDSQDEW